MTYITVVRTTAPSNKKFSVGKDRIVKKGKAIPISDGIATTVKIKDLKRLRGVLEQVNQDECLVLILGYIKGTKKYRLLSEAKMEKRGLENGDEYQGLPAYQRSKDNFKLSKVCVMDHDPAPDTAPPHLQYKTLEEVDDALMRRLALDEDFDEPLAWLRSQSNSTRVTLDGEQVVNSTACHYFFMCESEEDRATLGELLKRSTRAGDAFSYDVFPDVDTKVGKKQASGRKSVFDTTVFGPERILYDGKPTVKGTGLEVTGGGLVAVDGEKYSLAGLQEELADLAGDDQEHTGGGYTNFGTIPIETSIETIEHGVMTFEEYWLSDLGKIRCQSPLRSESTSEAGYLNRHANGEPFLYDTVLGKFIGDTYPDGVVEFGREDTIERLSVVDGLSAAVGAAEDREDLENDVCKRIAKSDIEALDREVLAALVQKKFHQLTGVKPKIDLVRTMLRPQGELAEIKKPAWCKRWAYLTLDGKYINLSTREVMGERAFNLMHGKDVPDIDGYKPSASKWVSDHGFMDVAVTTNYLPECDDVICRNYEGMPVVNSYRHRLRPEPKHKFSKKGKKAIRRIERHIKLLTGNDRDAEILLSWLAHNVQYPGRLIGWAPLIQSYEGGGKSFFRELLQACLGPRNVGVVAPSQLTTKFNGWANNVAVNVFEEIRLAGHNRHDALNALKPLITDKTIMITKKGVDSFMCLNTCNSILLTNFRDALPLGLNDRRYYIIFVPYESLAAFAKVVGDTSVYFDKLYSSMRKYSDEVHKWLMDYPLTKEFLSMKTAPQTDAKEAIIATERSSHEGLDLLDDLLSAGDTLFNEKVAVQSAINNAILMSQEGNNPISKGSISWLFKSKGWVLHPKLVKVKGKPHRFWTHKPMTPDEIRSSL